MNPREALGAAHTAAVFPVWFERLEPGWGGIFAASGLRGSTLGCGTAFFSVGDPAAVFSLSYFGMDAYHHGLTLRGCVVYLLGPWSAYRMGKSYVLYAGSRQALGRVLAAPALGMGLHGLLNWLACLPHQAGGAPVRLAVDVWRGDPVSVTCTGMLLTAVSALALGALAAPGSRRRKGAAVCRLGACLAESVYFANRTLPAICLLLLAGRALAWLFRPDVAPERKLRRCAGVFLCALPVIALLVWDVWGFGDWFVSLPLLERIQNPEAGISRVKNLAVFFQNGRWLRFPLGGEELTAGLPVSWFHNLWLDLYRQGGLLPFVLFFDFYSFGDPARPGVTPEHELRLPGDRSGCYGVSAACVVSQCHGGTGNGRQCVLVFMYFAFFGCSSGLGTAERTGGAGL